MVSPAHGPPWPRSWWRLLGVTSRSDAGSLPPPPAGPVAGGHGETADALLHDIYDDRSRPSSQLRRVAASAEIRLGERPGQRQQHERRQKSRPAGSSSAAKSRSSPAVMPKRGLSPVSYWGESRDVSGVSPCASHRYCGAEQRKPGGRPLSAVSPRLFANWDPGFRRDLVVGSWRNANLQVKGCRGGVSDLACTRFRRGFAHAAMRSDGARRRWSERQAQAALRICESAAATSPATWPRSGRAASNEASMSCRSSAPAAATPDTRPAVPSDFHGYAPLTAEQATSLDQTYRLPQRAASPPAPVSVSDAAFPVS